VTRSPSKERKGLDRTPSTHEVKLTYSPVAATTPQPPAQQKPNTVEVVKVPAVEHAPVLNPRAADPEPTPQPPLPSTLSSSSDSRKPMTVKEPRPIEPQKEADPPKILKKEAEPPIAKLLQNEAATHEKVGEMWKESNFPPPAKAPVQQKPPQPIQQPQQLPTAVPIQQSMNPPQMQKPLVQQSNPQFQPRPAVQNNYQRPPPQPYPQSAGQRPMMQPQTSGPNSRPPAPNVQRQPNPTISQDMSRPMSGARPVGNDPGIRYGPPPSMNQAPVVSEEKPKG